MAKRQNARAVQSLPDCKGGYHFAIFRKTSLIITRRRTRPKNYRSDFRRIPFCILPLKAATNTQRINSAYPDKHRLHRHLNGNLSYPISLNITMNGEFTGRTEPLDVSDIQGFCSAFADLYQVVFGLWEQAGIKTCPDDYCLVTSFRSIGMLFSTFSPLTSFRAVSTPMIPI